MASDASASPCRACDGTGLIAYPTAYTASEDVRTVVCDVCGGTGLAPTQFPPGARVRLTRATPRHRIGDEGTVVALYWSTEAIVVSFEDGSENVPPGALERIEA